MHLRTLLLALILGFAISPANAQLTLHSRVTNHTIETATPATLYLQDALLAMDVLSSSHDSTSRTRVVFNATSRQLTIIDFREESFMVVDESTMDNLQSGMASQADLIREQMENLPTDQMPPEAREQMMEAMRQARDMDLSGAANLESTPTPESPLQTGESDQILDIPCDWYESSNSTARIEERLCAARFLDLPDGEALASMLADMLEFQSELLGSMGGGSMAINDTPYTGFDFLLEQQRFPILTMEYAVGYEGSGNRILRQEVELVQLDRGAIDPSIFIPPTAFTRQEMFGN